MNMNPSNSAIRLSLFSAFLLAGFSSFAGTPAAPHPPRSTLPVGEKAPAFQTKTLDGKTVSFPADYKGKVLLLDFWATWCRPCREELPKVVSVYKHYHDKGFEVLSVSLDRAKQGPAVLQFAKDNGMNWPQIYDGQFWRTPVALQYGVQAIPCPVLVDGDTGKIIAVGTGALGTRLSKAVKSATEAKGRK
jgi:peroxiredoxin